CGYLMSLEKRIFESELNSQCGKAIMQDSENSSGTVQNAADEDIQRPFKIQ
ncbi:hypothetical protein A2U01_0064141, partial [Trifolium medium]|nr:hypothetical protein [Trifolium medium]